MAPALNEPLSSAEKLPKSTVTTVPKRSTRRSHSLGLVVKSSSPVVASSSKERRKRNSTIPGRKSPVTVRVTRSRDNNINTRAAEKTNANLDNSDISKHNSKHNKNAKTSKEQMGLSAALRTNNNNRNNQNNVKLTTSSKDKKTTTEGDSTKKILADLSINFEEAISAEICLRKQLLDANLNKEAAKNTNGTEIKEILVIKNNCVVDNNIAPAVQGAINDQQEQHMEEPVLQATDDKLDATQATEIADTFNNESVDTITTTTKTSVTTTTIITSETAITTTTNEQQIVTTNAYDISEVQVEENAKNEDDKNEKNVDFIISATEPLDNLEERLSQLDGSVSSISASFCVSAEELAQTSGTTTHQDDLQELQAQLQLSPSMANEAIQATESISTEPLEIQTETHQHQQQHDSTNTNMQLQQSGVMGGVGGTSELEDQDLEEVLKALKGFDPSQAGADTLGDLNALFNDVYTTINYDEVNTVSVPIVQPSTSPIKINPLQEAQKEIEKSQQVIQRKLDFLLLRLRKLQARHMCKHASEEIAGLFEYVVRTVNNKTNGRNQVDLPSNENMLWNSPNPNSTGMSVISARPPSNIWEEDRLCPVTTTQVNALLRKLETVTKAQQLCTASTNAITNVNYNIQRRKSRKPTAFENANVETPATPPSPIAAVVTPAVENVVPKLDALAVEEMSQVAGLLQSEMREVQLAIDSDATESSSECESADEMITYNNQMQQPLQISKRAAWRYARDRAAIASRWSWLLSQIADLDIKVRQHSELYNEIVRKKGEVNCNEIEAVDAKSVNMTGISAVGDYTSIQQGEPDENDVENNLGSCRTRGLLSKQFRKRKLLQTTNIHTISKKAARPSTIKCGCQWPLQPCALCTGRSDPTAPRELPNTMIKSERVALLDYGFHPVLSVPEDMNSSIQFEAIARVSEWQQRVMRCQVKSIAKSIWKAERETSGSGRKKIDGRTVKRRYIRKKDRLPSDAAAADMKDIDGSDEIKLETGVTDENNGTQSAMSTTPLVANSMSKQRCPMLRDIRTTTTTTAASPAVTEMREMNYHPTGDYPMQKYERYNSTHATTLISRKSSKNNNSRYHRNRKAFSSSSSSSSFSATASHRHQHTNNEYNYKTNNSNYQQQQSLQYHNSNGNSSSSEVPSNSLHMHDNWDYVTSMRSRTSSPTHASNCHQKPERSERKRSSYDIDNIVIPYSVAAATRVEIIPYKEIPTPKWRVIDPNNESEEDIEEDEKSMEEELSKMELEVQKEKVKVANKVLEIVKTEEQKIESALAIAKENLVAIETETSPSAGSYDELAETDAVNEIVQINKQEIQDHGPCLVESLLGKTQINDDESSDIMKLLKEQSKEEETREEAEKLVEEKHKEIQNVLQHKTSTEDQEKGECSKENMKEVGLDLNTNTTEKEKNDQLNDEVKLEDFDAKQQLMHTANNVEKDQVVVQKVEEQEEFVKKVEDDDTKQNEANAVNLKEDKDKSEITRLTEDEVESEIPNIEIEKRAAVEEDDKQSIVESESINLEMQKVEYEHKGHTDEAVEETENQHEVESEIRNMQTHKDEVETKEHINTDEENVFDSQSKEMVMKLEETEQKISTKAKILEDVEESENNSQKLHEVEEQSDNKKSEEPIKIENKNEIVGEYKTEDDEGSLDDEACDNTEDISDEVMATRHARALTEERRKFQTYLKFPWTTRSRANRRGDSRAESSGANTPDPTSPAPNPLSVVSGDQSIPSSAAATLSTPSTPFTPLESAASDAVHEPFALYNNNSNSQRRTNISKRRRTMSTKKEQETIDNRECIPPYEPLNFPLSDEDFENMMNLMPRGKRIESSRHDSSRMPIGSCGRGRNGLRRQTVSTSSLLRNKRLRLSNRPYVLNNSRVQQIKETLVDYTAFQGNGTANESRMVNGKNDSLDNAEETEDETETCEFQNIQDVAEDFSDTAEEEDEEDCEEDEEMEDDGFPRHPLATSDDLVATSTKTHDIAQELDDAEYAARLQEEETAYAAYVVRNDFDFSDPNMDSSDTEPFQDDDPNDPEWGGARRRRRP